MAITVPHFRVYPRAQAGGTIQAVLIGPDGKAGKAKSLGHKDLAAAILWRDAENEKLRLEFLGIKTAASRGPMLFKDAWAEYAAIPSVKKKSASTLHHEQRCFDLFAAWCLGRAIITIDQVTDDVVYAYRRHLQTAPVRGREDVERSNISINNYIRHVAVVWSWLVRERIYRGGNPFRDLRPLKVDRAKPKARPWSEVQTVLASAKAVSRDIHVYLILGHYFGIRKREILRVRQSDIDWQNRRITFHKSKPRVMDYTVNIPPDALEALLPYRQPGNDYLVRPDLPVEPTDAGYRWEPRASLDAVFRHVNAGKPEEEQIAPFSSHQLRHTRITQLRGTGMPLHDIAALMCQSELATTEMYGELGPEERRESLHFEMVAAKS